MLSPRLLPFLMWLFPLLFFAYQFILRLWPGLMMQQITEQFQVNATLVGFLASLYYYGYAGMQIPTAMLLDRFGARTIIFIFASICGLSMLVFTYTDNWYLACLSRLLIGAGSAAGFLGVSKVLSEWFTKEQYGRMVGFSFTFGLTGAIYGGRPISSFIESYDWRSVACVLSFVSIAIGIATYCTLRSPKKEQPAEQEVEQFQAASLKSILTSPAIYFLGISNLLMAGALGGFADVWGVQYLMTAYSMSKSDAAEITSLIFCGMIFGAPLIAACGRIFGNYLLIAICAFTTTAAFCILLLYGQYGWWALVCMFLLIGVMCCYQVLIFAAGADLASPKHLCVTIAFLNCINMLGGSFFHTLIGAAMDVFWEGAVTAEGVKYYGVTAYTNALMLIPICAAIGGVIVLCIGLKFKKRAMLAEIGA